METTELLVEENEVRAQAQWLTYDPIFELGTEEEEKEDYDVLPYEIIILNWLHEFESLTPDWLQRVSKRRKYRIGEKWRLMKLK